MKRFDFEDFLVEKVFPIVMAVLLIIGLLAMVAGERQWREFAREYNCREVERRPGAVVVNTMVSADGVVSMIPVIMPDDVAYLCDDEKIYWHQP